jgi:hypothetical protein
MEGRKCLFKRNGRLEKAIIKRVDIKSSKVVVSFLEGKCGRTLDINDILMTEEEETFSKKKNYDCTKWLLMLFSLLLLFLLTAYAILQYYKNKVIS